MRLRGHEQELRRADSLRGPADRRRRLGELVERRVRKILEGQDGALELCRERLRRSDRHSLEPPFAGVEGANERDVGAGYGLRGLCQRAECF